MPRPHQKGHKHSRRSHASPQTRSPQLGSRKAEPHYLDDDAPISFKFAGLLALAAAVGAVGGNVLMRKYTSKKQPLPLTVVGAFSTKECDKWVKEGPKAAVRTDDAIPHMHTWWLCRAGDNPCEAKGGHQQAAHIFRKLAFDQVDQHDWDLGANAHKKAQADLQILRYTKTDLTFNDLNMKWHVESGPPTNRTHPTSRWTRVLCGFMVLSPPKFYSGGAHQIGENNVSLSPGDIHFYLPGAPTKVYPLYKGELWVVLWHLWMPSAFDSEALQGYRATLVEPALRDLASKKRVNSEDRAAFNRFYGDLLYTEGRYEDALAAYRNADRGDHTDARAWHGAGRSYVKLRKCREATALFQKSVNAFIRQGQYYGDVTWLLDYAEVLVMPRAANQGRNLAEGLQTTKRALSHSRCREECLERLSVAWKTTKGSESDAARRLIRRSENGRLTLAAPYAERLQTQVPTTKSWSEANASSS